MRGQMWDLQTKPSPFEAAPSNVDAISTVRDHTVNGLDGHGDNYGTQTTQDFQQPSLRPSPLILLRIVRIVRRARLAAPLPTSQAITSLRIRGLHSNSMDIGQPETHLNIRWPRLADFYAYCT